MTMQISNFIKEFRQIRSFTGIQVLYTETVTGDSVTGTPRFSLHYQLPNGVYETLYEHASVEKALQALKVHYSHWMEQLHMYSDYSTYTDYELLQLLVFYTNRYMFDHPQIIPSRIDTGSRQGKHYVISTHNTIELPSNRCHVVRAFQLVKAYCEINSNRMNDQTGVPFERVNLRLVDYINSVTNGALK